MTKYFHNDVMLVLENAQRYEKLVSYYEIELKHSASSAPDNLVPSVSPPLTSCWCLGGVAEVRPCETG
jgi:hypothetical protein